MTFQDLKGQVEGWQAGHLTLRGKTYDQVTRQAVLTNDRNRAFLTTLCTALAKDGAEKASADRVVAAWEAAGGNKNQIAYGGPGGDSLMNTLCSMRIENINNFIIAQPTFMSWYFEEVSLRPDEEPYIVNETKNEVSIGYISEDGTPTRDRVVRPQSKNKVPLRFMTSPAVRYKTLDVYRGDVSQLTLATLDIARDMRIQLDLEHFGLLNATLENGGCFGAFSYEQDRPDLEQRIYVPHSAIKTIHFPTTNDYDLTATPGSASNPTDEQTTKFDIPVLRAILDYCARWGDLFEGGQLIPTGEILVPASDIIAIAEKFKPAANVAEQDFQKQITTNGYTSVSYLGKNWRFVPSLLIDKGTCFPRFNQVPGFSYFKAGLDRELVTLNLAENWEERQMRKVIGAVVINQRRRRAMRIKYAEAASA